MVDEVDRQSFDPAAFQHLFDAEDKHFWFRSRNRVIGALVSRLLSTSTDNPRLLEVGCGTGNVLRVLAEACPHGSVIGMDLFAEGLKFAQIRADAALVQGDVHNPPFHHQFNIIGLFDVLEHLPDDRQVLINLKGMLRKDGTLLLTVPANPSLWSYFDEASRHCRRYRLNDLQHKLVETGYEVDYITYYMMTIFPLMWAGRRLSNLRRHILKGGNSLSAESMATQELRPNAIANGLITPLLSIEEYWLRHGHTLPFGTSLLVAARNRQ